MCPKVHGYDQLHNESSSRNIALRDGRDHNHTVRNPHSGDGRGCHRTVQIIPIKCTNPQFKFNPQLLHSTSTPKLSAVTRIDYTGTLAKRRAQVITSKNRVQINLQQRLTQASEIIYNKVLQSRVTFQTSEFKHSGKYNKFETSFENTIR